MNAFIQNYNGQIALYISRTRNLIKDGFATVEEARRYAKDNYWTVCWVATTPVVAPVVRNDLISRLERAVANCGK